MGATLIVLLLWIGFAGTHMCLSSLRVRQPLVARLGEQGFRGLYSLVALAFFIPLVRVYSAHRHAGPWLWSWRASSVHLVMYPGMALAFVLLVASLVRPSPASVLPGAASATGAFRLTRHPLLMAIALFGLLHLLPNGSTGDIVFFGGFVVFSLAGARHQDRRKLATVPEFRAFYEATPFLPFTGRHTLAGVRELSPVVLVVALVATVVVRYFHSSWFGG
jgi:uncharacterized membrane protein